MHLIALFCFVFISNVAAQEFSVQGVLRDNAGSLLADGSYDLTFKLYSVSTGGTAAWTEVHNSGNQVAVANGIFATTLGGITSLSGIDFSTNKYLGVTVASDPELSPRITLTSVPLAISVLGTSNSFTSSGNVGVGTTSPTSPGGFSKLLQISGSTMSLILHDTDDSEDWEIAMQASGLLQFVNDGTTQMVIDNNGNVGIGTANPTSEVSDAQLRVSGAGHVYVDNNYGYFSINSAGNGIGAGFDTGTDDALHLYSNGTSRVTVSAAGAVTATGAVSASSFSGSIAASNINSGTIDNARLDADLQDLADGSLTGSLVGSGIAAGNISSGSLDQARLSNAFGSWSTAFNWSTNYLAGTDGFVLGECSNSATNHARASGYTDSGSSPTTRVTYQEGRAEAGSTTAAIMFPVRKGDYWRIECSGSAAALRFLPIGN